MNKQAKKVSVILCVAIIIVALLTSVLAFSLFKTKANAEGALADFEILRLDFSDETNYGKNVANSDIQDAKIFEGGVETATNATGDHKTITYTKNALGDKTSLNMVDATYKVDTTTYNRQNYLSLDPEVLNTESGEITFAGWFKFATDMAQWARPISVYIDNDNRLEIMPKAQQGALNISLIIGGQKFSNKGQDSITYNPVSYTTTYGGGDTNVTYPVADLLPLYGGWAHYAYSFTETSIFYYLNGELVFSVNVEDLTISQSTGSFSLKQLYTQDTKVLIGATLADGTNDLSASVADFRIYSKALTEAEVKTISGIESLGYENFLVTSYNFDDGTTKDSVRGYNGELINTAKIEYNSTKGSNVLALDGAGTSKNASMMIVDYKSVHGLNKFTISMDVLVDSTVGEYARLFEFAPNSVQQMVLAVNWAGSDNMMAKFSEKEGADTEGNPAIKYEVRESYSRYGIWQNVTLTVDGEIAKLYFNGVLITSGEMLYKNAIAHTSATKVTFGGTYYSGDKGTPCYMDNIKIYSTTLSEDDITSLYETETPEPVPADELWFNADFSDVSLTDGSLLDSRAKVNIDYIMSFNKERVLYNHRNVAGLDTLGYDSYGAWEAPDRGLSGQFASNYLAALARVASTYGDYVYTHANGTTETVLERFTYLLTEFKKCQDAYAVYDPVNAGYFGGLHMNQYNAYVGKAPYSYYNNKSASEADVIHVTETSANKPALGYGQYLYTVFPNNRVDRVFIWVPWRVCHDNLKALYDVYRFAPTEELREIGFEMMLGHADWVYNTIYSYNTTQRNRLVSLEYGGMAEALWNISYETQKRDLKEKSINYAWAAQYFEEDGMINEWFNNIDNLSSGKYNNLNGKHANTTIPKIFACVAHYEATEDPYYLIAAKNAFDMVIGRLYAFGGTSLYENWQHDVGCLETGSSSAETCCTMNMLKLADYLFRWTGDKKYADFYEWAFTNHILSSMDPNTGYKTYFVGSAFGDHKVYHTHENSLWCCTSIGLESFAKLNYGIYYVNGNNVTVNQFYASTYKVNDNISITQSGDFFTAEKTVITIDGSGELTLRIRIPDWAKSTSLKLNGATLTADDFTVEDGYYLITRTWADGDKLEYSFPFKFYTKNLNEQTNYVALMYGPLTLVCDLGVTVTNDIRQNQTEYPSLYNGDIADEITVKDNDLEGNITLTTDAEGNLYFALNTINQGVLTFRPFNQVFHTRYGMYFKLNDASEFENKYYVNGNTDLNTFDFEEDFSGYTSFGEVEANEGALVVETEETAGVLTGLETNNPVMVEINIKLYGSKFGALNAGLIVGAKGTALTNLNGYFVGIVKSATVSEGKLVIAKVVNGVLGEALVNVPINYDVNNGLSLRVVYANGAIYVYVNPSSELKLSTTVDTDFVTTDMTAVGLLANECKVTFDNFNVTSQDVSALRMLNNAIAYGDTLVLGNFTTTSFTVFSQVLANAKEKVSSANLSEKDLSKLNVDLRSAINNLGVKGDVTGLTAKITALKAYDLTKYTSNSTKNVPVLIAKLDAIPDINDLSVEEISALIDEIDSVVSGLILRADLTELNKAIAIAESLKKEDYLAREWEEMQKILASAKEINNNISQSQADSITKLLNDAIDALVAAPDSSGCNSSVSVYGSLGLSGLMLLLGAGLIVGKKLKRKKS